MSKISDFIDNEAIVVHNYMGTGQDYVQYPQIRENMNKLLPVVREEVMDLFKQVEKNPIKRVKFGRLLSKVLKQE